jgi:hypothetical protein
MNRMDFEKAFWKLWFEGQDAKERTKMWYPAKRPHQIPEEFLECLWICSGIPKPLVVEIGVMNGHQRKFWEKLLKARYIGIDKAPHSPAEVHGDSGNPKTREKVMELSGNRRPDILFVDGNHSYGGVKADWENWKDALNPQGFLCFHDTHHDHAEYCSGAVKLWAEVSPTWRAPCWDIFHKVEYLPRAQTGQRKQCGIGILQIPPAEPKTKATPTKSPAPRKKAPATAPGSTATPTAKARPRRKSGS